MRYDIYIFHNIDEYLIERVLAAIFQPPTLTTGDTRPCRERSLTQVIDHVSHLERSLKALYRRHLPPDVVGRKGP